MGISPHTSHAMGRAASTKLYTSLSVHDNIQTANAYLLSVVLHHVESKVYWVVYNERDPITDTIRVFVYIAIMAKKCIDRMHQVTDKSITTILSEMTDKRTAIHQNVNRGTVKAGMMGLMGRELAERNAEHDALVKQRDWLLVQIEAIRPKADTLSAISEMEHTIHNMLHK